MTSFNIEWIIFQLWVVVFLNDVDRVQDRLSTGVENWHDAHWAMLHDTYKGTYLNNKLGY